VTAELSGPLLTLFATSFAAATLVPLPSEAALFAYVHVYPERTVLAVAVATLGNTAGGMTTYGIGRLVPQKKVDLKAIDLLRRHGAPLTLLAWLPLVGDALCVAAGWLRMHWAAVLGFMAAGRLARYAIVAALSS
jgi:membrane protein YqaA with SNARE-associated domain